MSFHIALAKSRYEKMPTVDQTRIIGNYGTNLVAHALSQFCLVRPVAEGTDIGVDLYCETIEEGQAFLHFWVQVKSGAQIRIKRNGKASCKFNVDHLHYWWRQPVPVFAFYVPCSFPPRIPEEIYFTNLSMYLMSFGIPTISRKVIESDSKIQLETNEWHEKLISVLKYTTSYLKLRNGVIGAFPQLTQEYIRQYPYFCGISQHAPKNTLHMIRTTVSTLVFDAALLKYQESIEPQMNYIGRLIEILEIFRADKRPEILKALSLWSAVMGTDLAAAWRLYNEAIETINEDQNLTELERNTWLKEIVPLKIILEEIESPHN